MCFHHKPKGKRKTGDVMVGDVAVTKNLTEKQYAKFLEEATEEATKKGMTLEKYLQEIAEKIKLRGAALAKYLSKFEKKFHKHFDGEIVVGKWSKRDNTPTFWIKGAHNHTINGSKINIKTIRKPRGVKFDNLLDDLPFIANVELRYSNRLIPKQKISSFFPKNWDIQRIKEEVALIFDDLVGTGKDFSKPPFKFIGKSSDGTFEILIEFDKFGNITNAYPNIKI
ncbi:EndoU domain-containing protein [Olleya sp. ITB9]|uniref:EndoU domain-containing protein n=1 Tax=Olleya sp. ITB9 TaxID=1715648 RepID=UPI000AF67157|nr:EndoU domain-containing protein [Olleya sp. ITB9]